MRPFTYHQPDDLPEVCALLGRYGQGAKLVAGGTSLVNLMKQQLVQPEHVISLQNMTAGLAEIGLENGRLRVGSLVTHRELETSTLVRSSVPLLAEAYRRVATVRIRQRATVGGGLAQADAAMDAPAVWQVLDAQIHVVSGKGERSIPAREFFTDFLTTVIEPEEVIVGVSAPVPPASARWSYQKFLPRSQDDYATVSVAVLLELADDGKIASALVGLGSCGPTPILARNTSAALAGKLPTPELLAQASRLVADEIDPLDDVRGSAAYKKEMAKVFTRRALEDALR